MRYFIAEDREAFVIINGSMYGVEPDDDVVRDLFARLEPGYYDDELKPVAFDSVVKGDS